MTNPKGYRRGTRYLFSKGFRNHGTQKLSTFLKVYKRGDIVDIKGNGAFHKGMPHKFYHGKTGRIYNVTKHAVGIVVNKRVRTRVIPKKINVRIEHISHSTCRKDFLDRLKRNDELKKVAKEKSVFVNLKRQPDQPKPGHFIRVSKTNKPINLRPLPYELVI
ncbi:ribosomal protein L21 [Dermatophagoides farinae]|uniref:Large ribosomal subunit protein eL21 n=3 Tax=Pyroglyphidae TaxID=6952 RepID=A0A922I6F8_DERFA|nr:60S ribosomal protein L21-like [Dermatophagoides farinae]KAH7640444.1 60s ribosomal protein l21-like protein [Dermatophagoides farinae]KAH9525874.1 60S ribosomal protein L21 [Dermatophagoides farinae]